MIGARGRVRRPAVAGTFYPAEASTLRATLAHAFRGAVEPPAGAAPPAAIIAPHAGYVYSGPVAASAYARLAPAKKAIRRVVVLGPSHRVPLHGLALSSATVWETPLGPVPVDAELAAELAALPAVSIDDGPHAAEHSLEVQLPFLQTVLDGLAVVPLAVGAATSAQVADVIERSWAAPDSLVVISTDLSHYLPHEVAVDVDARTAAAIVARRPDDISDHEACGSRPLRGLLRAAIARQLDVELVDLRTSGDTAGDANRVVGYGSFVVG